MQEICKPSTFYKFSQCYLMVASFNLSKSLFRFRKLLQSKPRGRSFVDKFDRSKTPTVCFSEIKKKASFLRKPLNKVCATPL